MRTAAEFKKARTEKNLSLREVWEETGIGQTTISRVESGKPVVHENWVALSKFYFPEDHKEEPKKEPVTLKALYEYRLKLAIQMEEVETEIKKIQEQNQQ